MMEILLSRPGSDPGTALLRLAGCVLLCDAGRVPTELSFLSSWGCAESGPASALYIYLLLLLLF